jgi:hypothetical protein
LHGIYLLDYLRSKRFATPLSPLSSLDWAVKVTRLVRLFASNMAPITSRQHLIICFLLWGLPFICSAVSTPELSRRYALAGLRSLEKPDGVKELLGVRDSRADGEHDLSPLRRAAAVVRTCCKRYFLCPSRFET